MFEKSLYDLIRGLRNHKGNERGYIQHSLRECRIEIRGSDMDLKATALLKLIYLEMFGHDMSWASFHVLEVMSCPKYLQKRVGYLGAVQSFRPDTEVLMLATNLLKKDISSPSPPTISLPLVTLPHIITPSLALSLLSDLLPRLLHSNPSIRKKTVVALYRLALVYPDTLRSAWPKIKDLLMDEGEDSSVTAATINVVCELGWRRPRDFLPLAPRLFDLLVDGGNNWMAIKIIKLFATLTPLEPRLIKKLLPPLTSLIRTTPAMSLLYECINGIIQGGILEGAEGAYEGEEIATLCVGKLRGMIIVEGDPNLKYVALLAFNRIVASHSHLVSMHQDVIMSCIDDPDISIRLLALDLGAGMVNGDNLVPVVERLMQQLRNVPISVSVDDNDQGRATGVEPSADSDGEDPEETLDLSKEARVDAPPLPAQYKISMIRRILTICAKDTYANIIDFDWYIETLVQLVKLVPSVAQVPVASPDGLDSGLQMTLESLDDDVSCAIGWELRNIAVRISTIRAAAVQAADSLVASLENDNSFGLIDAGGQRVLGFAAWIVGEYASKLMDSNRTLTHFLHPRVRSLPPITICAYLQSIPKVFVSIVAHDGRIKHAERKSMMSLLLARIDHFLEPLSTHPNLEVQERSVELIELMRVAAQAVASHELDNEQGPLLLTKAIPSLFTGSELNPVAPTAQRKVPLPGSLNLDIPLNPKLLYLLQRVDEDFSNDKESADFEWFYNNRPNRNADAEPAFDALPSIEPRTSSYQQAADDTVDQQAFATKRGDRHLRNRDDPFYIASENLSSGTSTPFHEILRSNNGEEVDVDSIPIMNLDLGERGTAGDNLGVDVLKQKRKRGKKFHITTDENLDEKSTSSERSANDSGAPTWNRNQFKKGLLQVDSSGLGGFSLESDEVSAGQLDAERLQLEDADMAKALEEVNRLRLEMQRTTERIQIADEVPPEGTLVKKKKRKKEKALKGLRSSDFVKAEHIMPESYVEDAVQIKKARKKKNSKKSGRLEA